MSKMINNQNDNQWIREEIDKRIAVLEVREMRDGPQSDLFQETARDLEILYLMRDIPLEELPDEPWIQEHIIKEDGE